MQKMLVHLFKNNKNWSEKIRRKHPDFFKNLAQKQSPEYLWIGCADSRVPANTLVGLGPGELFVHRNIANVVVESDLNCLSVIQYAVESLDIQHIIVCGHYRCGGVLAAMQDKKFGLMDPWLGHLKKICNKYKEELNAIKNTREREDRLCEINVLEQVRNVCQTPIVQNAWDRGQALSIYGWIYEMETGHLKDLVSCVNNKNQIAKFFNS